MKLARAGSRLRAWQDREATLRRTLAHWDRYVQRDRDELAKTEKSRDDCHRMLEEHLATAPTIDSKGKPKWRD